MGNSLWGCSAANKALIANNDVGRKSRFTRAREIAEQLDEGTAKTIVAYDLQTLRQKLQDREITAVQALQAYWRKALEVNDEINCLIDTIVEAYDAACEMDVKYAEDSARPPLFGIPFSVKGNFYMKNYDCTLGLTKFIGQHKDSECSMVTYLRSQGAIPFVITNVPQALLSFVCSNAVYGTTGNPHNKDRCPGGSSGGEAALIAAGGAPFGIGSDLAGSLRIPAAMCGIVSLKPAEGRLFVSNTHGGVPGRGRLGLSYGFFTRTVQEQIYLLDNILSSEDYVTIARKTAPVPFRHSLVNQKKKLKIGYFIDDGFLKPVPGFLFILLHLYIVVYRCARAVTDTVEKLKEAGHDLMVFKVPDSTHLAEMFYKNLMPDGGEYMKGLFANDLVDKYMKSFVFLLKIPLFIRLIASYLISPVSPQFALLCRSYVSNLSELRKNQEQTDDYFEEFSKEWRRNELDALICPSFAVPSVPHEYPSHLGACALSTGMFNMLDYTAGVVPTGAVTQEDDDRLLDEKQWPVGYNIVLKKMREAAANSKGMPLAVQIVTPPFCDEQCLSLMEEVEELWKNN
uniref:Amidase domain-containing protein n=1 Tax=Steinernema glaseri TaxID=37863 RepID=A0A1I7YYJ1_9BILA